MNNFFSQKYQSLKPKVESIVDNFKEEGKTIYGGSRNEIKIFSVEDYYINIKAFKKPNVLNKVVYKFFRKSKAQRSFEYAQKLLKIGVLTPEPIAYFEKSKYLFDKSYYISRHIDYEYTFRDINENPSHPDFKKIIQEFTKFTFHLHQNDIEFIDHSPGNTLIKKVNGEYKFYLVDLNRMNFKKLTCEDRLKNFAKLTINKDVIKIMSDEYAALIQKNSEEVFKKMLDYTLKFQEKFHRKKKMKKKAKFWKS